MTRSKELMIIIPKVSKDMLDLAKDVERINSNPLYAGDFSYLDRFKSTIAELETLKREYLELNPKTK